MLIKLVTAVITTIGMALGSSGAVPTNTKVTTASVVQTRSTSARLASVNVKTVAPAVIWALGVAFRVTAHAASRMTARKVSQELVKQAIKNGKKTRGNQKGTSVYTQGKGKNRIRVIVNDKNHNIISVTKG